CLQLAARGEGRQCLSCCGACRADSAGFNQIVDEEITMPIANHHASVPVTVDENKCIADKGCRVCIDVCPLDVLWINPETGKAHMKYDECWYCMPCETDCPTDAVKVSIPYLLR